MVAVVIVLSATLVTSWLLQRSVLQLLWNAGLVRGNFRGKSIVPGLGIIVALSSVVGYTVAAVVQPRNSVDYSVVFGVILSAYVGLIDDLAGRDSGKGFLGHFGRSLGSFAATTGVLKAVFISLGGILVSRAVSESLWETLLRGVSVALTTNLLNLLDLRPGRCVKAYLAILALATAVCGFEFLRYGPVFVGAISVVHMDLQERAMLGDCGSNLLGFAVGTQVALAAPVWFLIVWAAILFALNIASEKYSFTSIIESNRVLRWLDMIGRSEH